MYSDLDEAINHLKEADKLIITSGLRAARYQQRELQVILSKVREARQAIQSITNTKEYQDGYQSDSNPRSGETS